VAGDGYHVEYTGKDIVSIGKTGPWKRFSEELG